MTAPHVFPFREQRDEERYYLPPRICAGVQREASIVGASDWVSYAQAKLDRELRGCSLLLTDEQVEMLHRYADVLGIPPQDLLTTLLAPEVARRERHRQQVVAFLRRHRAQQYLGCLATAVVCGVLLIIGVFLAIHLVGALGATLAHP